MIDVKIHSLFLHTTIVVESNVLILGTLCVGVDCISFDLPQWHSHVVGQHERHPVVIDKDEVRGREVVSAHLQEEFARNETIIGMNEMDLYDKM